MKKFTKIMAITLTVIMVMSAMTGCSLFGPKDAADLLAKSEKAMSAESGYTIDMKADFDADLEMDMMGAAMDLDVPVTLTAKMDIFKNTNIHGTLEMGGNVKATVEMDGEKQDQSEKLDEEMEFYIEAGDKEITTYQKDGDDDWTYTKTENSADKFGLDKIDDVVGKAEMTKEKEGYSLSIALTDLMESKAFDEIVKEADLEDSLEDVKIDEEEIKKLFEGVKAKYTFDKKYRLTGFSVDTIELDLGDMLKDLAKEMEKSDEEADLGELEALLNGGIKEAKISLSMSATIGGYGEVKEEDVVVSKKIKDEAVDASEVEDEDIDVEIDEDDIEVGDGVNVTINGEEINKDEDKKEENKKDEDEKVDVPSTPSNGTIDSDWSKLEMSIDGVVYKFPYDFAKLKSNGWTLDLAKYGKENGYILNPGDKTYSTLDLYSTKYGSEYDSFSIGCGFKNYDNSAKDITECDLWSVNMAIDYGSRLKKSYPNVEIAKGIKFGAKEADVLAAFGTPDDTYESTDLGYKTFTYDKDGIKARFKVSNEHGLVQIEYQNYN